MMWGVQAFDLVGIHREGRALHLFLRILQGNQEGLGTGVCQCGDVPDIRCAEFRRPRDQRRAIVDGGYWAEQFRSEGEKVASEQPEIGSLVDVEVSACSAHGWNTVL